MNLDPKPYVDGHLDVAGYGRRFDRPYPTPDHCHACGTRFAPRSGYSQDERDYLDPTEREIQCPGLIVPGS